MLMPRQTLVHTEALNADHKRVVALVGFGFLLQEQVISMMVL